MPGPSPSAIQTITGFPGPGSYKLWLQFKRDGVVNTVPFTFAVHAPVTATRRSAALAGNDLRPTPA